MALFQIPPKWRRRGKGPVGMEVPPVTSNVEQPFRGETPRRSDHRATLVIIVGIVALLGLFYPELLALLQEGRTETKGEKPEERTPNPRLTSDITVPSVVFVEPKPLPVLPSAEGAPSPIPVVPSTRVTESVSSSGIVVPSPGASPQELIEPPDPDRRRRSSSSIVAPGVFDSSVDSATDEAVGRQGPRGTENNFSAMMQSTATPQSTARIVRNAHRYIFKGTQIGACVMNGAYHSTVPSMLSCTMRNDTYGSNGKDILLPRGTQVVAEVTGAVADGQNAVFGLAAEARTPPFGDPPSVVKIQLDSLITDELGRGGMTGHVDTHFWSRIGSAIAISIAGGINVQLSNKSGNSGGTSVILPGAGNAAGQVAQAELQRGANIAPTLSLNQGQIINIMATRDLYFPPRRGGR